MPEIAEPLHSPDGKKRSGAHAASFGGPLVMQVVVVGLLRARLQRCGYQQR